MAIDRPVGVIREAFMGEKAVDNTEAGKMVTWARRVNAAIRPVDAVAKAGAGVACGKVVGEITHSMGKKFASVAEIGAEQAKWAFGSPQNTALEQMKMAVGQVTYLAIAEGGGGMAGTPDFKAMLAPPANVANLDAALPATVKGAGRDVVNCAFPNADVGQILTELNDAVEDGGYSLTNKSSLGLLQGYMDRIRQLGVATIKRNHPDRNQWLLVKNYVEALIKRLDQPPAPVQVLPPPKTAAELALEKAQAEYFERNRKINEAAENVTFLGWLSVLKSKSSSAGLPQAVWAYENRPWFSGTREDWNDYLDRATRWGNMVNQRRAMLASAREPGKAYYDENFPKLQEKDWAEAYNDPRTRLHTTLSFIVKDLYVEVITDKDGKMREITQAERNGGVKGIFAFRYKVDGVTDSEGAKVITSEGRLAYVERVSSELRRTGVVTDKDYADIVACQALDLIDMGGGFEGPDRFRKLTFVNEPVRTACDPGYKFDIKTSGGEVFGGEWNYYYRNAKGEEIMAEVEVAKRAHVAANPLIPWTETMARDAENKVATKMAFRDGLIPQVLCGSILDLEFETETGGKMSFGRAMETGQRLKLDAAKSGDVLYRQKKWFENAADFWGYVSGTTKLDFKGGIREVDAVLLDFAKGLNNAYCDLRDRGIGVGQNHLVAAVGGAAGIIPSVPPILNISVRGFSYTYVGESLVSHMPGLYAGEARHLTEYFAFGDRFAQKVPAIWENANDVLLGDKQRQIFRDVLRGKGGLVARAMRKSYGG